MSIIYYPLLQFSGMCVKSGVIGLLLLHLNFGKFSKSDMLTQSMILYHSEVNVWNNPYLQLSIVALYFLVQLGLLLSLRSFVVVSSFLCLFACQQTWLLKVLGSPKSKAIFWKHTFKNLHIKYMYANFYLRRMLENWPSIWDEPSKQ